MRRLAIESHTFLLGSVGERGVDEYHAEPCGRTNQNNSCEACVQGRPRNAGHWQHAPGDDELPMIEFRFYCLSIKFGGQDGFCCAVDARAGLCFSVKCRAKGSSDECQDPTTLTGTPVGSKGSFGKRIIYTTPWRPRSGLSTPRPRTSCRPQAASSRRGRSGARRECYSSTWRPSRR